MLAKANLNEYHFSKANMEERMEIQPINDVQESSGMETALEDLRISIARLTEQGELHTTAIPGLSLFKRNTVHLIFMNRYFNYHDLGFHPSSWAKRIVAHFTFYSAWITASFTFSNTFFENFIQHRLMKSFPGLRGE